MARPRRVREGDEGGGRVKFRIHGTYKNGTEDSVIVEGEFLADIRTEARNEVANRGWSNVWSEEIEEADHD